MSKISDWQKGFPPCDGIWEIKVDHGIGIISNYYARFKEGKRSSGNMYLDKVDKSYMFIEYDMPFIAWRGLIDD